MNTPKPGAVERFDPVGYDGLSALMTSRLGDGDYVRHSDYATLAAELATLREDARRYMWLRGHGVIFDEGREGDGARRIFGIGLDTAIDRAGGREREGK